MDIGVLATGARAKSGKRDAKPRGSIALAMSATRQREPVSTSPPDVDARLDEALQMTFPASDPISVSAQR
jgi:hypothetical protein